MPNVGHVFRQECNKKSSVEKSDQWGVSVCIFVNVNAVQIKKLN